MSVDLLPLAQNLANYEAQLKDKASTASVWANVESTAQKIANGLRSRGAVDYHTALGESELPRTITALLKTNSTSSAKSSARTPVLDSVSAAYELLRVGANLCMNHDPNRARMLAEQCPQTALAILQSYSDLLLSTSSPPELGTASPLNLGALKVIKTAFGFLLNASMDYAPVRSALVDLKAPATILRLTSLIYPSGSWLKSLSGADSQTLTEEWTWRSGLSAWSWRALETLQQADNDLAWDTEAMPYLIGSLTSLCPPYQELPSFVAENPELRVALLEADLNILQEISSRIEALSADEERLRALLLISTGKSVEISSPNSPFVQLLNFIEHAGPPPYWAEGPQTPDLASSVKTLSLCKAAIIKAIVTVAGEDSQMDVLWGQNDPQGGWFVRKMIDWIRTYREVTNPDDQRNDLIICATLCLGNLARREARCVALVEPPISIAKDLIPLLVPSTDIKMKHGVLGLLKNLAQTQPIKGQLGEANIIEALSKSLVLTDAGDIAEVVQLSAVGIVKHLATSHIPNALRLFKPVENGSTGFEQIIDLVRRTDSMALRNESTRVLVNLVKTLWTPPASATSPIKLKEDLPPQLVEERRKAFDLVTCEETADALAEMVGRNARYPILLNEGIMALTLLASQNSGVPHVLTALTSPLVEPINASRSPPISEASTSTSPNDSATAATALDMLVQILATKGKSSFPPELRSNACSLLSSVGRRDPELVLDSEKEAIARTVRTTARPSLTVLASEPPRETGVDTPASPISPGGATSSPPTRNPNMVRNAAARALTIWGPG